jgi:hypothetical protein
MKMLRREQLGETTSAEILLPQLAEEIESLSLSDKTSTRFLLGLENSAASYSAIIRRKNLAQNCAMTRTAPQFDSYPDSDDDFDSDLLNLPSLTIMATPQSRVVYWKNPESTGSFDNARLVACLRDLPYQSGRPPLQKTGNFRWLNRRKLRLNRRITSDGLAPSRRKFARRAKFVGNLQLPTA